MIIWKGFGILVPAIMFAAFVLAIPVSDTLGKYSLAISQLLAAGAIWWTGRTLNGKPGRLLQDPQTGEMVELKSTHSLFFIKMEYWAVLVGLIGVAALFVE